MLYIVHIYHAVHKSVRIQREHTSSQIYHLSNRWRFGTPLLFYGFLRLSKVSLSASREPGLRPNPSNTCSTVTY